MQKHSLLHNKNVYVAMPKRLFHDEIVSRALRHIHTLKPLLIDDPREMFASNAAWVEAFPRYLAIYNTIVVISDDDTIGMGVYLELQYFKDQGLPCYFYYEYGNLSALRNIITMRVIDEDNWRNYAKVIYE